MKATILKCRKILRRTSTAPTGVLVAINARTVQSRKPSTAPTSRQLRDMRCVPPLLADRKRRPRRCSGLSGSRTTATPSARTPRPRGAAGEDVRRCFYAMMQLIETLQSVADDTERAITTAGTLPTITDATGET